MLGAHDLLRGEDAAPTADGAFAVFPRRIDLPKAWTSFEVTGCFPVMRRFCKWLMVVSLMLSIGLQWVAMQSAAWVGMLITYSQESGVRVAIKKTFDGHYACKMCKKVAEGMKEGSQKAPNEDAKKRLDQALFGTPCFVFDSPVTYRWEGRELSLEGRSQQPLAPPPRTEA